MDIRQLQCFISVAEHLNFTEAARRLYLAQPNVSQQIADLESKMGVKLFLRNKRSVQLTAAGTVFLQDARDMISRFYASVEKARQAEMGIIGTLKIGCQRIIERKFLPRIIRNFRTAYPNIELELIPLQWEALRDSLENGELDICFTFSIGVEGFPKLVQEKLYTDYCSVLVHKEHPLAERSSVTLSSLADEPFIIMPRELFPPSYDATIQLCTNSGFFPRIASQPRTVETVFTLVEGGMGVAILARCLDVFVNENVTFVNIDGDNGSYDVVAAWSSASANPSVPIFIDELRRTLSFP